MNEHEQLRVAIDAQLVPWRAGGTAFALTSLLRALARLQDGHEVYKIVVATPEQAEWWRRIVGPNQEIALKAEWTANIRGNSKRRSLPSLLKRFSGPLLPWTRVLLRRVIAIDNVRRPWPDVPVSEGFYESLGCDVLHFPHQHFVVCAIPTVFNPHDLQHMHYPQFWTPEIIAWRETIYPAACHFARTIVVGSNWAKQDVIRQYRIYPEKVTVIPEGAPTGSYAEPSEGVLREIKNKYKLNLPFMLYPAVTWAHKNHLRLLEALAYLRDSRDLVFRLVCVGARFERFWPRIEKRIHDLKLESQVTFLGFVPDDDLRALYRLSDFLIQPSLFEASSLPIFEAWLEGTPVACSNGTALPEQVMDAGLLFDPNSIESIADAILQVATSKELRAKLRARGYERLKDFDWDRTARAYRAVYRQAARLPLTDEDRWLLEWDWMREPRRDRRSS
jgi:glycosyltransferase involved in cell wall biosynthesis